jgi:hypothetical protein
MASSSRETAFELMAWRLVTSDFESETPARESELI